MIRMVLIVVAVVVVPSRVAVGQIVVTDDPAVGCYDLELGVWSPGLHPANAPMQTPPSRFELQ
jgi:hypothetical protein